MKDMEFTLNGWRENVSIMGLINILEYSEKTYDINHDRLRISSEVLEGFEEDYFKYFIDRYEKDLPWYRLVNYKEALLKYSENLEEINKEELRDLNEYIDLIKDYLRRPNYMHVYNFIDPDIDIKQLATDIKKINLRKGELIKDRYDDIEEALGILEIIMGFLLKDDAKKYMGARGVIYSHIKRGINGISFLNPTNTEKNPYREYREYFIEPLQEYLEADRSRYRYECFTCKGGTNASNVGMGLLKDTSFDIARKSSYVWNYKMDVIICPKCLWLYTMSPAGFNYKWYSGIFANYNSDVQSLYRINTGMRRNMENKIYNGKGKYSSYRTIVASINEEYMRNIDFELNDIQLVQYEYDEFRFNLLSKEALDIVVNSKDYLNKLMDASYQEREDHFSLYDMALERIFNNQNMFNFIYKLIMESLSDGSGVKKHYNMTHVWYLIKINNEFLKPSKLASREEIFMKIDEIASKTRIYGLNLKRDYIKKMGMESAENKLKGVSYRLTNAMKTKNQDSFMENILNSYMYVGSMVPALLSRVYDDEDLFGAIGYPFIAGLNGCLEKGEDKNEE